VSWDVVNMYIVDIQGFPPCKTTPSWLSFWEEAEVKK
jgi:hypothetical protein